MALEVTVGRMRSRLARGLGRFRYGISALDQMALSLFTFGLNICLVRALSATEFGIVSLWIALSLLAMSVQNALVNVPLNVHLPAARDNPERVRRLEEAASAALFLAVLATTVIVVLVNLLSDAEWAAHDWVTAIAIPVFMASGMYREYSRTMAFGRRDVAMLLWTDGPYLAVTTACLAVMLVWPERYANLAVAFFAMSIGCIVSQICLRTRFILPKLRPFERGWIADYWSVIGDVKWALVGVFAAHLQARSYLYVTVNLVSLAGLASISVVGILFRPVRILLHGWNRSALPFMAAQLASGDVKRFDRTIGLGLAAGVVGSAVWLVVVLLLWGLIERHFLVGRYPDARLLIAPWAVAALFDVLGFIVSIGLQAAREFRFLAYATMITAPISLAATTAAVLLHDYTWTMYGVAVGNLFMLGIEGTRLLAVRRRVIENGGLPAAADDSAAAAAARHG